MFREVYKHITTMNDSWNALKVAEGEFYEWSPSSTYIHDPPYFDNMTDTL